MSGPARDDSPHNRPWFKKGVGWAALRPQSWVRDVSPPLLCTPKSVADFKHIPQAELHTKILGIL